ncbi:MAG: RNA-binding cell elongation regulator Jag/EloR [Lachnospiraceae bacterium]|jgi:spoIIIJ-associated protein
MKKIEVTGKTVEDAVTEACIQLGISSDRLAYEVLEQGSTGILGLFAKPAKISAWEKSDEELADDRRHQEAYKKVKEITARTTAEAAGEPEKKTEEQSSRPAPQQKKENNTKKTSPEKAAAPKSAKVKTAVRTETEEKQTQKTSAAESASAPAKTEKRQLSHEEIEKRVTDFLGAIFQSIGLKETITFSYESDNTVVVDIEGDNTGIMIGKRGQTLDSLQYLTSLVVNKGREKYIRIKLDTENYRHRREETLKGLARNMAGKAKRTGHPVELEPMNPYERRIIHSALQNDRYVSTKSEGEEPYRHVVIFIDRTKAANRRPSDRDRVKKEEQE